MRCRAWGACCVFQSHAALGLVCCCMCLLGTCLKWVLCWLRVRMGVLKKLDDGLVSVP